MNRRGFQHGTPDHVKAHSHRRLRYRKKMGSICGSDGTQTLIVSVPEFQM